MEDVLRLTTQRVIDHPIGSMPSSVWSEAHLSILSWLELSTVESVTIPFQLLDRLVQEAQAISTTAAATTTATAMEEEKGPSLPEFFQTDLREISFQSSFPYIL